MARQKQEAHKLIKDYQLPGGVTFKKGVTVHLLPGAKVQSFIAAGLIADPSAEPAKETKSKTQNS